MATLRIIVPKTEQADGVVEYAGDVAALVDDETRTLYVQQGTLILAEYPADRYESWELIDEKPAPEDKG